jgi:hypothetical protein
MASPILPSEFNASTLTLGDRKAVEIEKQGKKQIMGHKAFVNYGRIKKLTLQSALSMRVPFGLNVYEAEGGGQPKYSINIAFDDLDSSPEVRAFHDAIQAIDDFVFEQAAVNSESWFGKKKSRDALEENFTRSVKLNKKDPSKYAPTMKVNLRKQRDGTFEAKLFDVKGEPYPDMPIEDILAKNVQVTAAVDCADVWIGANGKFNVRWNVTQLVVHSVPQKASGFSIKLPAGLTPIAAPVAAPRAAAGAGAGAYDEEDEEEDNLVEDEAAFAAPKPSVLAAVMPVTASAASAVPAASAVADDEDDDEEEAPAPKKPVLKKKPVLTKKN